MKTASVAEVKARLGAFLKASEAGPVIITRNGRAVAVLTAVTDEDDLERLKLAHSPKFRAIIEKSHRQIRESNFYTHEEFWKEVAAQRRADARKNRATGQPDRKRKAGVK